MSSAWGGNYWVIEQIKPAMYVAYFRNEDAMDFVLKRQPWSVESDNLLFEWINPKDADRDVEDYHFRFIYVPIRVYGVPERFRTPSLMRFVIDNIAQPSDLHPPPEITMTVRKDYIQAYARMEIQKPVKDKVKYYISPKEYILFYLNYDKVKRICIFCGLMFHSVQNCPNRTKLIRHLQSINVSTSSVPFSNIGIWTSQAKKIPVEAFQQSNIVGGLAPEFRRDFKMERAAKANQLSLSRFKISDKNEDRNTATEKLGLTSNQAKAQLTLESTSFFGDPLFAQPEFNQAAFFKHKSVIDPTPQQRLKRHAEPEEFPIQEEMQNAEMRTEHPLAADLSKVYCPLHKRKQQVPENSDIIQKSSQTLEQQHQCSFRFTGGTSQPPPCSRKKLRTYKRHRCNEKIQYVQASTSDLIPKENQFWKPLATSLANSLDKSVNVTHQVQNQLNKDPGNNRETLYMEENEENSQKEEQAAAPAFKAPRAQ
ncbi:uncharacterized protein [Lolium perenne]|uniref:uncharacterized protein n=1 Tax=Lolium perenne TaxID=4522 RepID=UPI003A99B722